MFCCPVSPVVKSLLLETCFPRDVVWCCVSSMTLYLLSTTYPRPTENIQIEKHAFDIFNLK